MGRKSYEQIVKEAIDDGIITWADIIKIIEIIREAIAAQQAT